MTQLSATTLARLLADVEAAGGPETPKASELLVGGRYQPGIAADPALNPFGQGYSQRQAAIYREITGKEIGAQAPEPPDFDMAHHLAAANPEVSDDPSRLAARALGLMQALASAGLPAAPRVLDLDAAMGLTAELLATLGCQVTALAKDPRAAALIKARAKRLSLPITATPGDLAEFATEARFDLILLRPAEHGLLRIWSAFERMAGWLAPGGQILLLETAICEEGAPWGLRLDAQAVWRMATSGRAETCWSRDFLTTCATRAGLSLEIPEVSGTAGLTCRARALPAEVLRQRIAPPAAPAHGAGKSIREPIRHLTRAELREMTAGRGWLAEGARFVSQGEAGLLLPDRPDRGPLTLSLRSFRAKPIPLVLRQGEREILQVTLNSGVTELPLPADLSGEITISSETWVPRDEIGNTDERHLSFHLEGAAYP